MVSLIARLPDVCDDFAADALLLGLVAGHHAGRGGDDRSAHAALHARDLVAADVAAPARAGDPLHAADHGVAVLGVLELDPDRLADLGRLDLEAVQVALLDEDPASSPSSGAMRGSRPRDGRRAARCAPGSGNRRLGR